MADPYLGEVRLVSFDFAPKGWALCNGQTLSINQNTALFSLLGTFYGGNGTTTFQLPNLQGGIPMNAGEGYYVGETGGEANVTLTIPQLPSHLHTAQGVSTAASVDASAGNAWAESTANPYTVGPNVDMAGNALASVGGTQPHNNLPPYLVMNYIIALVGIYPPRN